MNEHSRIIDLRPADLPAEPAAEHEVELPPIELEPVEYEEPPGRDWSGVATAAGVAIALAWLVTVPVLAWQQLAELTPLALAEFVAALCVPPALIAIVLLLLRSGSRAEARRFGQTARSMRGEAASLERTVAGLSHSIDASRSALAEQTTLLAALGDHATQRLETVGSGIREQVAVAQQHAGVLNEVTQAAHGALAALLADLPRTRDETAEAARLLDAAGQTLEHRATTLDERFLALAEHGRVAELTSRSSAEALAAQLERVDTALNDTGQKLARVVDMMAQGVDQVLHRTAHAVDEARKGVAAQSDAMLAMTTTHQAALERGTSEAMSTLTERVGAIETAVDRIAGRLMEQREVGSALLSDLDQGLDATTVRFDALARHGSGRAQELAASISALTGSAEAMHSALEAGQAMAAGTIGTTEQLLTALDAASREIDETLPDALIRLDRHIAITRDGIADTKPELLALVTAAESTHDAIEAIAGVVASQRNVLDKLSTDLLHATDQGRRSIGQLDASVERTIDQAQRFADEAAPRLVEALLRVRDTANAAAERAHQTLAEVIPQAAAELEHSSGEALARAAAVAVDRRIAAIGTAAEAAADAAERAAERLSCQLQTINAAAQQVESRFAEQRADNLAVERESLPRRMTVLIEALNSASIDITRAFSSDVADSSWAAYLKGDRGVFTRRAVRLLDQVDAREIARLYDADEGFRDQVNRYIHDFEAMLRQVLSGGESTPIGVTLLSSDVGKLYVALAQATERLKA